MISPPIVTVDGASGSGKSTLGRLLALKFRLPLIDTGLFYRGVMVAAVRAGVGADDPDGLAELAHRTSVEIDTDPASTEPEEMTRVDGAAAGDTLRDPRNAPLLSLISSLPAVRAAVLAPQRSLAARGAVAVGRDCGTVVFPAAPVKLYLAAPEQIRERRRREQLRASGLAVDADALKREVADRDRLDSQRSISPLRPAPDAQLIDTGAMAIEAVFDWAVSLCLNLEDFQKLLH